VLLPFAPEPGEFLGFLAGHLHHHWGFFLVHHGPGHLRLILRALPLDRRPEAVCRCSDHDSEQDKPCPGILQHGSHVRGDPQLNGQVGIIHLLQLFDLRCGDLVVARIHWNEDYLVQIIQRRLSFASDGRIESLDAISEPGLNDVDCALASLVNGNPRSVVRLAGQLLEEHYRRSNGKGKLNQGDLDATREWLKQHPEISAFS